VHSLARAKVHLKKTKQKWVTDSIIISQAGGVFVDIKAVKGS